MSSKERLDRGSRKHVLSLLDDPSYIQKMNGFAFPKAPRQPGADPKGQNRLINEKSSPSNLEVRLP